MLIAVILVFSVVFGVKMDVEFRGGTMLTLSYQGEVDLDAVEQTVSETTGQQNLNVQTGSDIAGNQTMTITMPGSENMSTEEMDTLMQALTAQYPDNAFEENEINNVNPTIGNEFCSRAWWPW